jgi:tetratricopeptide (TPR) repeat protein
MDKEKVIEEYRNTVDKDSVKARKLIKKLNYKDDYYLLKCVAQTYLDESRFKDDGKSNLREYLDKRKWRMAERYIIKAFTINPNSADVLYTMGEIRKLYGQIEIAIYCFEKISKMGIQAIAYGEYGRGMPFARELINDSKFELYRLYHERNPKLSKRYLSIYKKGLEKGIKTIYKPLKKFLLE